MKLNKSIFFILLAGCSSSSQVAINKNIDSYKLAIDDQKQQDDKLSYSKDNQSAKRFVWNKNCEKTNDCPFYEESEYLGDWPPKVGIAFSGGGTRSASFSIGVLKALHDTGILESKAEVISGVSGGAYATYWYFSQKYYMWKLFDNGAYPNLPPEAKFDNNTLFKAKYDDRKAGINDKPLVDLESANNHRFQKALEESSDIMSYRHDDSFWKPVTTKLQYGAQLLIQGLSTPIYWVTNSLFDWEINITPFFYYYKDGLNRTYGFVPIDFSKKHFFNAQDDKFFFAKNIDAIPLMMDQDFKAYFEYHQKSASKSPYFIINATGVVDAEYSDSNVEKYSTENRIVEFTPWSCHSVLFDTPTKEIANHDCKDYRLNSPRGYEKLDLAKTVAISGAAVDGKTQPVDTDGNASESSTLLETTLDILHLNLGYHIDNPNISKWHLMAHKLLPWPLYLLDDALSDQASTSGIYLSDGGHSENLGVLPLIRRGVKEIYLVDAEQDDSSSFQGAKRLNNTLKKYDYELCSDKNQPLNVYDTNDSFFEVSVQKIGCTDKLSTNLPKIYYIKLSAPVIYSPDTTKNLPYTVISYMKDNPKFPHESTVDIFYSPEQFMAYRDLGYKIARDGLKKYHLSE